MKKLFVLLSLTMLIQPAIAQSDSSVQAAPAESTFAPLPAPADAPLVPPKTLDVGDADLSITGTVRAKEIRFDQQPSVKVRFTGSKNRKTSFKSNRKNFPKPVVPGTTYKNPQVDFKILTKFELPVEQDPATTAAPTPANGNGSEKPAQ